MNPTSHNRIIECLEELSNRCLQESLWMGKRLPEQSSFVEAVEGLFTDTGLDGAINSNTSGYSHETESKLQELKEHLKKVNQYGGPMMVINDPAMPRVRELAAEILSLIPNEIK